MATPFRIKRSAVPGKKPAVADLQTGELALNTYDGYLFSQRDTGGVGIGTTVSLLTPWIENYGGQSIYYNQSVGIGTTNATSKLTVVGDANISGVLTVSNGIQGIGIQSGGISITAGILTALNFVGAGNSFSYNAGTKTIDIDIGGGQWTYTDTSSTATSNIYRLNGNVGIGTTNPTSKLTVVGNANITGVLTASNGIQGIGIQSGGVNITTGIITTLNFVGTAVSTITNSSGLVEINVKAGQFTRGTSTFTATAGQTSFSVNYTPNFIDVFLNGVRLTSSEFTATNGTSVVLTDAAFVDDIIDVVVFQNSGLFDSSKWSAETPLTPSSGNIYRVSGNVGIGTTNPTSKLTVSGNVNVSGVVTATTFVGALNGNAGSATTTTNIPNLTGAITSNNTTTSLGSFTSANLSAALTDETGSGSAVFATSPTLVTPILGIASATSLNVSGIVTALGGFNLGIQSGGISVTTGVLTALNFIGAGNSFSYNAGTKTIDIDIGGGQWTYTDTSSTATSNIYRLNGNVGIGTTSGKARLDIEGVLGVDTTVTGITTTAISTIDTLPISIYRSARFQVQITQSTDYQSTDLMVVHNGTTANIIEYGSVATNDYLASFSSTISASNLLLQATMGSAGIATVKVVRYGVTI